MACEKCRNCQLCRVLNPMFTRSGRYAVCAEHDVFVSPDSRACADFRVRTPAFLLGQERLAV